MHTFQRRFTITPLAIIRPEHSRTISGTGATKQFFQVHTTLQGRKCPKQGTYFTAE